MTAMSESAPPNGTARSFEVGARLLILRQVRGISQRELARRASITNANLSMIEQGRVSPSITTLEKILVALDLSLPEFFTVTTEVTPDIFSHDSLHLIKRGGSEYRLLPSGDAGAPHFVQQTLPPGVAVSGTWLGRRTWISGLVQNGLLSLWLDNGRSELRPGDAFRFHLQRPHKFANETEAPVVLVLQLVADDL